MVEEEEVTIKTRFRFDWKYWQKPSCGTPVFISNFRLSRGDHFKVMKQHCDDIYEDVMQSSLCPGRPVEGGSCVILYETRKFKPKKETPYIFTKDKRGYKIAYKLDKKGKKRRIGYAKAQTLQKQLKAGRKKRARKQTKASYHVFNFSELGDGCRSV